jgi:hypothetical protein
MTSPTIPTAETPERVNPIGRIFGVFFTPKATFESIARRPTWLLPVILLCIVSLGVVAAFSYRGGWRPFLEKQLESSSRFQQLPVDQQQRSLDLQLKYATKFAYGEFVVAPFLLVLIVAAVFLGMFNMVIGTQVDFKTSLGVVSHAYLPGLIASLLGILIIFLKDPTTVDFQNLLASNVGAFMPSGSAKWLVTLLGSLDIFSFWGMILMAVGFSAASPKKLSFGKAFGTILFVWLIYVLVRVGISAAFS